MIRESMSMPISCPSANELRGLLDGANSQREQSALARHLEECPRCQQTLDRLVADAASWAELPLSLRRELVSGPALKRVIEGLKGQEPVARQADLSDLRPYLSPPERPEALGKLGSYHILGMIGRGGMSVVLRALDPTLNRLVAVKVLAPHLASSGAARQRFTREARAAAAVCHEHVIAVHAVDDTGELPFLVMEYVPGKSLQQRIDREGSLPLVEVLRIGHQVAGALAAAHAQGLVHRDVKPGNILLENGVERVRLGDFGLARAAADAGLTEAGVVSGTPQYMAPEQAQGENVDARADLFSLGSVLYAMCTGRAPFVADSPLAIVRRVCDDQPPSIRSINPTIPEWLEAIVTRLHAKSPDARFASASEVAELLRSCLAHVQQPALIALPRVQSPVKQSRWSLLGWCSRRDKDRVPSRRRRRILIAVLLLLVVGGLAFWFAAPFVRYKVRGVGYSPDGKWMATAVSPGAIKLTGPQQVMLNANGFNDSLLAFSPDSQWLATGGFSQILVWSLKEPRPTPPIDVGERLACLGFTQGGKSIVAVTSRGRLHQFNLVTRKREKMLELESPDLKLDEDRRRSDVRAVLSADGETLAWWASPSTPGPRSTRIVLQSLTKDHKVTLDSSESHISAAAFSPDGKRLAWGGFRGEIWMAKVDDPKTPPTGFGHRGAVYALAFSPDSNLLAVGNRDGDLTLWDATSRELFHHLGRHWGNVYCVAWSADGRTIASGSRGREAKLWDVSLWVRKKPSD